MSASAIKGACSRGAVAGNGSRDRQASSGAGTESGRALVMRRLMIALACSSDLRPGSYARGVAVA